MKKLFLLTFTLLLFTLPLHGAELTFEWDANPSADEVLAYVLYEYQTDAWVEVGRVDGTVTTLTLSNVDIAARRYHLKAENAWGESGPSNEVILPSGLPSAPNLRITITIEITP